MRGKGWPIRSTPTSKVSSTETPRSIFILVNNTLISRKTLENLTKNEGEVYGIIRDNIWRSKKSKVVKDKKRYKIELGEFYKNGFLVSHISHKELCNLTGFPRPKYL